MTASAWGWISAWNGSAIFRTGEAQQFVWNNILAYSTAKMLDDMGCGRQVYERIKDTDPVHCHVVQLAREIKEREGL